ncbi:MAG: hypothetical protein PHW18_08310 [Sulfuricurvum sp.]|uniref:hypothetical protein n=1 Tax=Sulfuricurvum sp. TaxID=2025608 RepID=UPI0026051B9B|nr:hypothetical protein [Sulfuricurvum sp.]MDD2829560.1 hypothetical protein [Sulfuricurvum sp.]MDD4950393.1 hypothetical protein [Sulfuricurvum sp.]
MSYTIILLVHSWLRWIVVVSLLYSLYRAYTGWFREKSFTNFDNSLRHSVATIAHIQLLFGLLLYGISPIISYFLSHFSETVHIREIRFFGLEHSVTMLLAIFVITLGSMIAKRQKIDRLKFRTIAIWYTIAFILIIVAIPWEFSSMVSRPYFRI